MSDLPRGGRALSGRVAAGVGPRGAGGGAGELPLTSADEQRGGPGPPADVDAVRRRVGARLSELLKGERRLALAVSGGGDSVGLLVLATALRAELPIELTAATVDHRLRPESADEAAAVAALCARFEIPHTLLEWRRDGALSGNLQAAAREARYELLRTWRRALGVGPLATAHTEDDVAETFLLRLARGSGVDGLSEMPAERVEDPSAAPPLRVIRPLLEISRAELRAVCRAAGAPWTEDPSNADRRFDRVKARQTLEALAPLGLGRVRLAKTARTLKRARHALERATDAFLAGAASVDRALGVVRLRAAALGAVEEEIALRALARILAWSAGAAYPPRLDTLIALSEAIRGAGAKRTLHGCVLEPVGGSGPDGAVWVVSREPARVAGPVALAPGVAELWDGRFRVRADLDACRVQALGEAGWAALAAQKSAEPAANTSAAPRAARLSAPSVWRGDALLAAPAAGRHHKSVVVSPRPLLFPHGGAVELEP